VGLAPSVYGPRLPDPLERRSRHLGGWPFLSHPAEELSPCGLGTCLLSTSALRSHVLGVHHPSLGGGFDGELTLLAWAAGWRQPSGACVTLVVLWGVSTGVVKLAGCRFPLSVSSRRIGLWC
jgi:hypothetical protein